MNQKNEQVGRCVICGVAGQGEKDFICESCGGPRKTTICCRNCQMRMEITDSGPEEKKRLLSFYFSDEELQSKKEILEILDGFLGYAISIPQCICCINGESMLPGSVLIYKIRDYQFHDVAVANKNARLKKINNRCFC